jgi:hypothetical protein
VDDHVGPALLEQLDNHRVTSKIILIAPGDNDLAAPLSSELLHDT